MLSCVSVENIEYMSLLRRYSRTTTDSIGILKSKVLEHYTSICAECEVTGSLIFQAASNACDADYCYWCLQCLSVSLSVTQLKLVVACAVYASCSVHRVFRCSLYQMPLASCLNCLTECEQYVNSTFSCITLCLSLFVCSVCHWNK